MLLLVREHTQIGSMHWQHVLRCYKLIDDVYDTLDAAGMFLTDGQSDTVKLSLERFTLHFSTLTQLSAERGAISRQSYTSCITSGFLHNTYPQSARGLTPLKIK